MLYEKKYRTNDCMLNIAHEIIYLCDCHHKHKIGMSGGDMAGKNGPIVPIFISLERTDHNLCR